MKTKLTIALMGVFITTNAYAWEAGKIYAKATAGNYSVDEATIIAGTIIDDNTIGVAGSVGYSFNEYVGVEGGFIYPTEIDENTEICLSGSGRGGGCTSIKTTVNISTLTFAGIGRLPVSDNIGILGKLGYYRSSTEVNTPSLNVSEDETDSGAFFGAGVDFIVTESIAVMIEYDHYDKDNFTQIGLRYSF